MHKPDILLQYDWLSHLAHEVQQSLKSREFNTRISSTALPKEGKSELIVGGIAGFENSAVIVDLNWTYLSERADLGYWAVFPNSQLTNTVAELAEVIFGDASVPSTTKVAVLPRNVLVREFHRPGKRVLGVLTGFAPSPRTGPTAMLVQDIAYFFYAIACLARGEVLREPKAFGEPQWAGNVDCLGWGKPISRYPCPSCVKRLHSYDKTCPDCGWGERDTSAFMRSQSPFNYELSDT